MLHGAGGFRGRAVLRVGHRSLAADPCKSWLFLSMAEPRLMPGVPNHSRPMIRVETLVLAVTAWMVATANGAWWKAIGQGRDWSQPGNWLFLVCCFITIVGLHFVVLAPFAFRL